MPLQQQYTAYPLQQQYTSVPMQQQYTAYSGFQLDPQYTYNAQQEAMQVSYQSRQYFLSLCFVKAYTGQFRAVVRAYYLTSIARYA